jgi:RNA polymerase primary sigma factor
MIHESIATIDETKPQVVSDACDERTADSNVNRSVDSSDRDNASYRDVIASYLRDIGNRPLLTRTEEVEIAGELAQCKQDVADYVRAVLLKADDSLGLSDIEVSEDTKRQVREAVCGRRADRPIEDYVAEVRRLQKAEAEKHGDDLRHRILVDMKDSQVQIVVEKLECAMRVARKSLRILHKTAKKTAGSAARVALQTKRVKKAKIALAEVTDCLGISAEDLEHVGAVLAERREKMDAARKRLVEANLRLVIAIAKRFKYRGVHFGDLIQEGNVALMRAVEGFDPFRGFAFATFAGAVIRRRLGRVVRAESSAVHVPNHIHETERKVKLAAWHLSGNEGEHATPEEISEFLECPIAKVTDALSTVHDPVRLDKCIADGPDNLIDHLEAPHVVAPIEALTIRDQEELAEESLAELNDREQTILTLRYGSDGDYNCTLEEVGQELGVTRERIRQIESRALRKLRIKQNRSS